MRPIVLALWFVAACGSSSTPASRPPSASEAPPVVVPALAVTTPPAFADACARDQIVETLCGGTSSPNVAPGCGPRGDSLTSFGEAFMPLSAEPIVPGRPRYASLSLDRAVTEAYRTSLAAAHVPNVASACCYSRCTPLTVTASAVLKPAPPDHVAEDLCLPPPPHGTSAPSQVEPTCPGAIALANTWLPLRAAAPVDAHDGYPAFMPRAASSCCYTRIVARRP